MTKGKRSLVDVITVNTTGHGHLQIVPFPQDIPGCGPDHIHQEEPRVPRQHHTDPNPDAHKARAHALQKLTICMLMQVQELVPTSARNACTVAGPPEPTTHPRLTQGPHVVGLGSADLSGLLPFPKGPTMWINFYVDFAVVFPKNLVTPPPPSLA